MCEADLKKQELQQQNNEPVIHSWNWFHVETMALVEVS